MLCKTDFHYQAIVFREGNYEKSTGEAEGIRSSKRPGSAACVLPDQDRAGARGEGWTGMADTAELSDLWSEIPSVLSIREAAELLSVSQKTVRKLILRGELPIVRTEGDVQSILKIDLIVYLGKSTPNLSKYL
jgi:excisionase family DNA binding protein